MIVSNTKLTYISERPTLCDWAQSQRATTGAKPNLLLVTTYICNLGHSALGYDTLRSLSGQPGGDERVICREVVGVVSSSRVYVSL